MSYTIEDEEQFGRSWHRDDQFFKYLGDGEAEIDSNACGEPNYFDAVPCGDFYVKQ